MSKRQLIEEIRRFNGEVPPKFLSQFDPDDLRQYLEHLKAAQQRTLRTLRFAPSQAKLKMVS
ncbi:MAG TPA: hypothetical protein VHD56_15440 [Tepidisphaeraceae bacterium]|nr:hypothetical protein [Tepidisphaeraceae bacterium]